MSSEHVTVLLQESVDALEIRPEGLYLDATFGRGGHSREILSRLGTGRLFALDRDPQAATEASKIKDLRFSFVKQPFSKMETAFSGELNAGGLDGVLFDLGVSSPQLDQAERGFSFSKEGPLDMRMDCESGLSAYQWLQQTTEMELAKVIRDFGGESYGVAKRVAKAVFNIREKLQTTTALAEVVSEAMPKKLYKPGHHPATQTFQAIRMAVNDEFGEIQRGLDSAVSLLKNGGILAVITFHGGEDALVKRYIRRLEGEALPAEIPLMMGGRINQVLKLINPVIKPSKTAVAENPRCRSARLRKAIKL